jgi:hypothetical protein
MSLLGQGIVLRLLPSLLVEFEESDVDTHIPLGVSYRERQQNHERKHPESDKPC